MIKESARDYNTGDIIMVTVGDYAGRYGIIEKVMSNGVCARFSGHDTRNYVPAHRECIYIGKADASGLLKKFRG